LAFTKSTQNRQSHQIWVPVTSLPVTFFALGSVCWLLNDERSAFVTGVTISVDGGFLASSGV
jgi:hypothetical protein